MTIAEEIAVVKQDIVDLLDDLQELCEHPDYDGEETFEEIVEELL